MTTKVRHNIPVSFQNVHDFKYIDFATEEDHIPSEGEATNIGTQFGAGLSEQTGQRRQFTALLPQGPNKRLANRSVFALPGDVSKDIIQVVLSG